jgi:hypothetical protein
MGMKRHPSLAAAISLSGLTEAIPRAPAPR